MTRVILYLSEVHWTSYETAHFKVHRLINSIWNREELPDQWRDSIIVDIYIKGDKTECNN
jgi:hypothetical protein